MGAKKLVYIDRDGATTSDASRAAGGDIVEEMPDGESRKIGWFGFKEVELSWLPVRESAFLLWVLAFLAIVWVVIGVILRLT